jgi:hypothetical protein
VPHLRRLQPGTYDSRIGTYLTHPAVWPYTTQVIRVLLECCLNERTYNPYYALLAGRLCQHSHNHKFTLQYAMWDHFKQVDQTEVRRGGRGAAGEVGTMQLLLRAFASAGGAARGSHLRLAWVSGALPALRDAGSVDGVEQRP